MLKCPSRAIRWVFRRKGGGAYNAQMVDGSKNYKRWDGALTVSFVLLFVGALWTSHAYQSDPEGALNWFFFVFAAVIIFYVFIGLAVRARRRSIIIWVGLTILGSPFSFPITYIALLLSKEKGV